MCYINFIFLSVALILNQDNQNITKHIHPSIFTKQYDCSFHKIPVPNLQGMKYKDAQKLLKKIGLDLGAIIYTLEGGSTNPETWIIYKQNPESKNDTGIQNYLEKGKKVDVWVVGMGPVVDTLETKHPLILKKDNS